MLHTYEEVYLTASSKRVMGYAHHVSKWDRWQQFQGKSHYYYWPVPGARDRSQNKKVITQGI